MESWVWTTFGAALAQTVRFMLQKHLSTGRLSAAGATFARFVYAAPLAALIAFGYGQVSSQHLPMVPASFWAYALTGGISQILATICVVLLLRHRNFAVGITFKKTEVILSVLMGLLILGEGVSWLGFGAILLGLVGVLLLSDPPGGQGRWLRRIGNRAAGLGLASGVFFGISGVGYRGASLSLESGDAFLRAVVTLTCVTALQTVLLGAWLIWHERGQVRAVFAAWRVAGLVGLTSLVGSICWFTAFTLQTVGYVNAVGQVELVFSLAASALVFHEKITARELAGVAILTISVVALVLVA
ncbi:MAG: EamA family transporter [Alphaproteobacteria bacterium]|jgi:drug/metabolite transporter (DMT)-like permease|nr:EamA family transporter [Alphaproteobacteria bacterium]